MSRQPGVGKGNWGESIGSMRADSTDDVPVRPPKEERERRAAQKKAALADRGTNDGGYTAVSEDAVGEDEDAEGEEE